jgi:hypothetical protein
LASNLAVNAHELGYGRVYLTLMMMSNAIARQGEKKMNEPQVNENYAYVFGMDCNECKLVYLGGIKFLAAKGDKSAERESQDSYNKIVEYINRPTARMGL